MRNNLINIENKPSFTKRSMTYVSNRPQTTPHHWARLGKAAEIATYPAGAGTHIPKTGSSILLQEHIVRSSCEKKKGP